MKKYLIVACLFVFGCSKPPEKKVSFVSIRNEKCLMSAKQVISNVVEVNCNTVDSLNGVSLCVSRISKIKTVEFRCRKFDDGSWYADNFNTINYDSFKE
jgi:hypothetical protein